MSKIYVVRKEGGSRIIAVTKIIPVDWNIITIQINKISKNAIVLKLARVK